MEPLRKSQPQDPEPYVPPADARTARAPKTRAPQTIEGLSADALPEYIRRAYTAGRRAGRLASELSHLVRALAVHGGEPFDYGAYLARLGLPCRYPSRDAFVRGYLFDARRPDSLARAAADLGGLCDADAKATAPDALGDAATEPSAPAAFGDAAVRQARQAAAAFDRARMNQAPILTLQKACDCWNAFARAALRHLPPVERAAMASGLAVERLRLALATGAPRPAIWQALQPLLALADGAVLPLDLAALYRLQVQGRFLARGGRLIAPREDLRATVEHVFRV